MTAQQEQLAVSIVDDLVRVFDEPPLDPRPVSLADFRRVDRRFYEQRTAELTAAGFSVLRDLDASALLHPAAPPTPLRALLGEHGAVGAAIFHSIPKSPGFLLKLLLRVLGAWKEARVVELMSFVGDDVIDTMDVGSAYFFSSPPWVHRTTPEAGLPLAELLDAHLRVVARVEEQQQRSRRRFESFEAFMAAREAARVRQNQWRRELGGFLPEELDRMLAPHGEAGQQLRPFVERELERRNLGGRAPAHAI